MKHQKMSVRRHPDTMHVDTEVARSRYGIRLLNRLAACAVLALFVGATIAACNDDDDDDDNDNGEAAMQMFGDWQALNPAVDEHYEPLNQEWVGGMGIHWGVDGPHVTIGVGHDDQVTLVELIVPAADGWHPWFDQDENEPVDLGFGDVYTQHIYLVEQETIVEGEPATPLEMTFDALEEENPALVHYEQTSSWVPGMGYHWAPVGGPSIVLAIGDEGEIHAFEIIVPESDGWHPWFDQDENEPIEIGGDDVYTQHVYIVPPESID